MTARIYPIQPKKKIWEDVKGVPYLKLNTESGVYFVRKYKAGKGELFRSTGQKTKMAAVTAADEMIAEWLGGKQLASGRKKTISTIVDELDEELELEFKNGDRRAKTRAHDKDYLPLIKKLFGEHTPDQVDEEFWQDWIRHTGKRMRRETFFDLAKYLSKTLTFAYRKKYIVRKPQIRNPDKPKRTGRVYADDEVASIVSHADEALLLQIALGYECGLRVTEVRAMEKSMILDWEEGCAVVSLPEWFVKANARTIRLSPRASQLLKAWIEKDQTGSRFVFPSKERPLERAETEVYQNRRWRKAVQAANATRIKEGKPAITGRIWFRYLRQSFYDKAILQLGLPIQQVGAYGGTSIRTLQKHYLIPDHRRTAIVSTAVQLPEIRGKFVGKELRSTASNGKDRENETE